MYPEERRLYITTLIRSEGRLDAAAVADRLEVTGETVRKDLISLERQGVLQRTHGGAILVQKLGFEPSTEIRALAMVEQKRRIATAALLELPEEGAVFLDAGTTIEMVADFLPRDRSLMVVSNSLRSLQILATRTEHTVMSLGGRVRVGSMALIDAWAVRSLSDIRVDVAFIGANGVTAKHGLTTSDPTEAALKEQIFRSSQRSVVLADSSKLGAEYFHRFARISEVDVLITDDQCDLDIAEDIRKEGPRVVLV